MNPSSSGRLEYEFKFGTSPKAVSRDPDAPFRIVMLADFSGHANRGVRQPVASRPIVALDCDNFDEVFAGLEPALNLSLAAAPGQQLNLRFQSLEHAHPDQLLKRIPWLSELANARRLLLSPTTAAEGANELERLLGLAATPSAAPVPSAGAAESLEATMSRLLGGSAPTTVPTPPMTGKPVDVQALINQIVSKSKSASPAPAGQPALLAATELELASRLRAILHHADFQALESAWRGVDFLVRRLPDEGQLQLAVLDVSLEELSQDAEGLHRLLRDEPPDLLIGNYTFGALPADLKTLGMAARLCASLGSAFLAAAHPQLLGCDSFAQHPDPDDWNFVAPAEVLEVWQALRRSPEAGLLALAAPRFLLRQPYGVNSDPIDAFGFEELLDVTEHEAFLWGNPALLCAYLLADACTGTGGRFGGTGSGDIGELPVFQFTADGERTRKPCAEAWLVDRAVERITSCGVTAVQSFKGRDAVRVSEILSITEPRSALRVGG